MNKEAYYFSHDSNARNDEKLLAVRMKHGAEGYGIYFMIVERLREDSENMSIKDYNVLAFDFRVSADKVKSIIEDFKLFEFTEDGKKFYSKRMMRNMKEKNEKSEKARNAAQKRWENTNAMQTQCERSALKESKVKESKEENIIPPISPKGESGFNSPKLPNVSNLQKEEERKKVPRKKERFDLDFVNTAYLSIVKDFIDYRKEIRKPFKTTRGVSTFYNKLIDLSGNNVQKAKALAEYAKGQEWQTVYEIKENETSKRTGKGKERDLAELARNIEQGYARGEQQLRNKFVQRNT